MSQVVDFLNEAQVYYLATVENDQPQVRPIGAVISYDNKIYFTTNNQKAMYDQMIKNPNIAISGMADGKWIRISGKAVFEDRDEVRSAMLDAHPSLKSLYHVGDGIFEVFYIDDMKAVLYSFDSEPVVLEN